MRVITKLDCIPNYATDVVEILKERAISSGLKIVKVFDDTLPDGEPGVVYTHLLLQGSRLGFIRYFGRALIAKGYCENIGEILRELKLMFN